MENTLQHLQQILCFMLMWPTSCVESLKMRSQTQTVDPEGLFIQGFNTTELMLHILFRDDRPTQAQSSLITRTSVTLGSTEETVHHHSSATIIRAFLSWWGSHVLTHKISSALTRLSFLVWLSCFLLFVPVSVKYESKLFYAGAKPTPSWPREPITPPEFIIQTLLTDLCASKAVF